MKKLLFILLFILPFGVTSQITLNSQDSSFNISYLEAVRIKDKVGNLKSQVNILIQIGGSQDLIIKKLRLRDSLHYLEIEQYEKMDSIMREKNNLSNSIINNYKVLLISTEDLLRKKEKEANKQRLWKNIYRIGYPVLILTGGILILK